jgi:hypothetical protein
MLKVAGGGGGAGAVRYLGTWDAATNTPTLTSGVGSQGDYYVVSVSGNTNLDGITDWVAGDWAIFNGTVWEKVDNTESVISVNGQTGVVVLTPGDIGAAANTVEIIAGVGLDGGGNLAANVTIDLANTSVVAATYGGGSNAAEVTVDAQGRITAAANVAIPQGTVTNIATGTGLDGGPITSTGTISLANTAVTAGTYGDSANSVQITVDAQGRLTAAANVAIPQGTVTNIATGTGLTGGPITSTGTISLANTAVTAGTYGSGSFVPQIIIDAQGRITSATNVAVTGASTVVTDVATVTNGTLIDWENVSATVITWENNALATIGWTNNVYLITANNATILVNCAAEPLSTLLPSAATVSGQQFKVKKIDSSANAATITTTSSQTIDGNLTYILNTQYKSATVQSDGSNWWVTAEVA